MAISRAVSSLIQIKRYSVTVVIGMMEIMRSQESVMRKPVMAIIAAAAIATAAISSPKPAEARCWGCWAGVGIAAGLIGGAIIASNAYGYGYGYGYGYPASYGYGYAPAYYGGYVSPYYGGYYAPRYYARPYYPRYYAPRYYARPYFAHRYYGHRYYR
jgi:hypothetical protein